MTTKKEVNTKKNENTTIDEAKVIDSDVFMADAWHHRKSCNLLIYFESIL